MAEGYGLRRANDDGDNSNNKNKNGGIGDMLHHLGNGKKIGATFKFSIPVSLSGPLHQ